MTATSNLNEEKLLRLLIAIIDPRELVGRSRRALAIRYA